MDLGDYSVPAVYLCPSSRYLSENGGPEKPENKDRVGKLRFGSHMVGAGSEFLPLAVEGQAARPQDLCMCMNTASQAIETSKHCVPQPSQGQPVRLTAADGVTEALWTKVL